MMRFTLPPAVPWCLFWSAWATTSCSPKRRHAAGRCTSTLVTARRPSAWRGRFVEVFSPYDVIVVPSASCAGTVADSYAKLAEDVGDRPLAAAVAEIAPRTTS